MQTSLDNYSMWTLTVSVKNLYIKYIELCYICWQPLHRARMGAKKIWVYAFSFHFNYYRRWKKKELVWIVSLSIMLEKEDSP